MSPVNLVKSIYVAYDYEQGGNIPASEKIYTTSLDEFSKLRKPAPLLLIHYLDFVRRNQGTQEAIFTFEDLITAESDHISPDVKEYVYLTLQWFYSRNMRDRSVQKLTRSLHECRGKPRTDMVSSVSDFLAFSQGDMVSSVQEIARLLQTHRNAYKLAHLWDVWDQIILEFGCSLSATLHQIKRYFDLSKSKKHLDPASMREEDIIALLESKRYGKRVLSWLVVTPAPARISHRLRVCGRRPSSSLLEQFLDPSKFKEDSRDGGEGETNHIYRPDVSKMTKFVPSDDVNRKIEVPKLLRSFIACLPIKQPRSVNISTLAESCLRLLVSISLPRSVTDDMLVNVDKRARLAIDQQKKRELRFEAGSSLVKHIQESKTKEEAFESAPVKQEK
jgi:hypothetical protein